MDWLPKYTIWSSVGIRINLICRKSLILSINEWIITPAVLKMRNRYGQITFSWPLIFIQCWCSWIMITYLCHPISRTRGMQCDDKANQSWPIAFNNCDISPVTNTYVRIIEQRTFLWSSIYNRLGQLLWVLFLKPLNVLYIGIYKMNTC